MQFYFFKKIRFQPTLKIHLLKKIKLSAGWGLAFAQVNPEFLLNQSIFFLNWTEPPRPQGFHSYAKIVKWDQSQMYQTRDLDGVKKMFPAEV